MNQNGYQPHSFEQQQSPPQWQGAYWYPQPQRPPQQFGRKRRQWHHKFSALVAGLFGLVVSGGIGTLFFVDFVIDSNYDVELFDPANNVLAVLFAVVASTALIGSTLIFVRRLIGSVVLVSACSLMLLGSAVTPILSSSTEFDEYLDDYLLEVFDNNTPASLVLVGVALAAIVFSLLPWTLHYLRRSGPVPTQDQPWAQQQVDWWQYYGQPPQQRVPQQQAFAQQSYGYPQQGQFHGPGYPPQQGYPQRRQW